MAKKLHIRIRISPPPQPIRLEGPYTILRKIDLAVFAAVVDVPDDALAEVGVGDCVAFGESLSLDRGEAAFRVHRAAEDGGAVPDVLVHMALGHNEVLLDFADET